MPIFGSKKSKSKSSQTYNRPAELHFPSTKSTNTYKRRKPNVFQKFGSALFSRKTSKSKVKSRGNVRKGINKIPSLIKPLLFVLLVIIFGAGGYFSIRYIIKIRLDAKNQKIELENVYGFKEIPAFPKSEFVFKNSEKESVVEKFIAQGNSSYRLPANTPLKDVEDFYKEQLPKLEWENVLNVPLESETQKPGSYWVKNNRAVRIYFKLNDVWYQSLTVDEAKSGLSAQVNEEKEKQQILNAKDYVSLLPNYPWRLKVPPEYLIKYEDSSIDELQTAIMTKISDSKKIVYIVPIGKYGQGTYDKLLSQYFLDLTRKEAGLTTVTPTQSSSESAEVIPTTISNTDKSKQVDNESKNELQSKYKVVSTVSTTVNGLPANKSIISGDNITGEAYVIGNYRKSVVYVIYTFYPEEDFFQYLLRSIQITPIKY